MDPQNPASFNHKTERLSTGRTYHFVDQLPIGYDPTTTRTLLCVHGFPDLWYGWRYQIGPWTRKGFRVVVPDMLGYGGTDKPSEYSEYSTKRLSDDLAALLSLLGIDKAILIGHDWGSYTVGRFALWYPDRILALIMISAPFTPPSSEYISVEDIAIRRPNLSYQVYFADPKSTHEIEANLRAFLKTIFATVNVDLGETLKKMLGEMPPDTSFPVAMNDMELEYYHSQLKQGMQGPLSYYRTSKVRFEEEKAASLPSTLRPDLPVLFLWGTVDPILAPGQIHRVRKNVPGLRDFAFEGVGHWIMVECRQGVADRVTEWLGGITPTIFRLKTSL